MMNTTARFCLIGPLLCIALGVVGCSTSAPPRPPERPAQSSPDSRNFANILGRVTAYGKGAPDITVAVVIERPDSEPAVEIAAETTTNYYGDYNFRQFPMPRSGTRYLLYVMAYQTGTSLGISGAGVPGPGLWTESGDISKPVSPRRQLEWGERNVEMFPLRAAEGSVEDERGKPIGGAKVFPWPGTIWESQELQAATGVAPTVSDQNGRYVFDRAPGYPHWGRYRAEKPGYVSPYDAYDKPSPTVILYRPRSLTGRVIDSSGRPMAGVKLVSTITAKDGSYTLTGIAGDHFTLSLSTNPLHLRSRRLQVQLSEPPTITKAPDLVVERGVEVSGKVTVAGVGAAADGYVTMGEKGKERYYPHVPSQVAADGRFKLWLAPGRTYRLGFNGKYDLTGELDVDVPPNGARGLNIKVSLPKNAGIGTVVDEAGEPVPGAEVVIMEPGILYLDRDNYGHATANSEGRFGMGLVNLKPGEPVTLQALDSQRHLGILQKVSLQDLQSGKARLVLETTANVRLEFRDEATRRPIPGVHVFRFESRSSWCSNPYGEVTIDGICRGGPTTLSASKEGYSPTKIELPDVGSWEWSDRKVVLLSRTSGSR